VIGQYFFKDDNGNAVTITGKRYREMLTNFVFPNVQKSIRMWWQKDGATVHSARKSIQVLRQFFGKRIISRNVEFSWPQRLSDLTAPDVFYVDI